MKVDPPAVGAADAPDAAVSASGSVEFPACLTDLTVYASRSYGTLAVPVWRLGVVPSFPTMLTRLVLACGLEMPGGCICKAGARGLVLVTLCLG